MKFINNNNTTFLLYLAIFLLFIEKIVYALTLASENEDFIKDESKVFKRRIKFRNSYPEYHEQNRCAYIALDPSDTVQYITKIEPIATSDVAHHMSLVACKYEPKFKYQRDGNTWDCGKLGVCGYDEDDNDDSSRRLYTWALNANGIEYPEGVGYRLGGDTGLNYLAVQVHYNRTLEEDEYDSYSSYVLTMTTQDLPYQVGVYTLGDDGVIPPGKEHLLFESGCHFNLSYDIVPIFYRTHAHNLVTVISGYLVRDGHWIELGRMSPKQPQAFYPVTNSDLIVTEGDILGSRCTINSIKMEKTIYTGYQHDDEMCVFYLMFYTDYKGKLDDFYCYEDGNKFNWKRNLRLRTKPPKNASNLKGVHLLVPENEDDLSPL